VGGAAGLTTESGVHEEEAFLNRGMKMCDVDDHIAQMTMRGILIFDH
jgi:hypothetical protein